MSYHTICLLPHVDLYIWQIDHIVSIQTQPTPSKHRKQDKNHFTWYIPSYTLVMNSRKDGIRSNVPSVSRSDVRCPLSFVHINVPFDVCAFGCATKSNRNALLCCVPYTTPPFNIHNLHIEITRRRPDQAFLCGISTFVLFYLRKNVPFSPFW